MTLFLGLVLILALMIPLVAVILDSQFGRALAGRLERSADDPALAERVAALEAEAERLAGEVERLEEANRFLQRLIERRGESPASLPPGDPHV